MSKQYPEWVERARETVNLHEEKSRMIQEKEARHSRTQYDKENREMAQKVIDGIRDKIEKAARTGKRSTAVMYVGIDPDTRQQDPSEAVAGIVEKHCQDELGLKTWWSYHEEHHNPGQEFQPGYRELYVSL